MLVVKWLHSITKILTCSQMSNDLLQGVGHSCLAAVGEVGSGQQLVDETGNTHTHANARTHAQAE